MAVPTISVVSPAQGPSAGLALVQITGTNFRLPDPQPTAGPTQPRKVTVQVLVGGEPATDVEVVSTTTIYARTPQFLGAVVDTAIPPVGITVTNLDNNGNPVAGETVTVEDLYTYVRPQIHGTLNNSTGVDSPYTLVSHALIRLLQRQVLANVSLTTHVDYAEPGVITLNVSHLPALVVQGPTVVRDNDYGHNEPLTVDNGDGTFSIKQPPNVRRLTYSIIGVSDNERELINIIGSLEECFKVIKYLATDLNPVDATQGRAYPVLQLTAPPQTTSAPSDSNIRTFISSCEVRGVEVFSSTAPDHAFTATTVQIEAQQSPGTTIETIDV